MKLSKHTFFMIGVMSVFSLQHFDAMAIFCNSSSNHLAPAGTFCKGNVRYDCRAGCYCLGGGNTTSSTDIAKKCRNHENPGVGVGVNLCPDDFPESAPGSNSAEDCYKTMSDGSLWYNRRYHCPQGHYLVANSKDCSSDCPAGKICKGGDWIPYNAQDQGVEDCPTGMMPNDNQDACIEFKINCIAGTYLPENSSECAACPDGYYCPGSPSSGWTVQPISQGTKTCQNGRVPNETKTACVQDPDNIPVTPGYYLKANATAPSACFGAKKFCPGGTFSKQPEDQGRYDCPFGANATADNKGCQLKLTKKQMENGASGAGKCWLKTDINDFKSCIYGVRIQETAPTAAETPTIRDFLRSAGSIGTIESLKSMDK